MTSDEIPTFKCVIVGDGGVGKTTFVKKHLTGEFVETDYPTQCVEVNPLVFQTSAGYIRFNIWDTAGQEQYRGLGRGYFPLSDCVILVFSLTSTESFNHVNTWKLAVENEIEGQIPKIVMGTNYDNMDQPVSQEQIAAQYGDQPGLTYYNVSSMSNYNIEQPFLTLTRQLLGNDTITFIHE